MSPAYKVSAATPFGVLVERNGDLPNELPLNDTILRLASFEPLLIIRGFEVTDMTFQRLAEALGKPILNADGSLNLHDLREQDVERVDRNFTRERVPLHWDGWGARFLADYQIFRCLVPPPPGTGGATFFSHTAKLWRDLSHATQDAWRETQIWYQLPTSKYENVWFTHPFIAEDPRTHETVIRFAEKFADGGQSYTFESIGRSRCPSYDEIIEAVYNPSVFYRHEWQRADIVIANNNTLLHGREAYSGPRHLHRILVSRP